MSKFLDSNGLSYFWGKLKAYFVAKEVGKGLSTNDFTTAEKNKLAGIEAGAEVNTVTSVNGQTGAVTVPSAVMSDTAPLMDGTASAGVSDEAARGDHVHPHDLSLLPLDTVTGNPIVVTDAYPTPAEGLTIALTPYQSGSGTPSPSNIRPISGYSDVKLARYRKNLFNKDGTDTSKGYVAGKYLSNSGGEVTPGSGSFAISEYIPILPNISYTVSGLPTSDTWSPSICQYDSNHTFISGANYGNSATKTITTGANAAYVRMSIPMGNINSLQLEVGNTATSYESYISPVTVNVHMGGLGANKWDGLTELGTINTSTGESVLSYTQLRTVNYVPVVAGQTYRMVTRAGASNGVWTFFYDSNKTLITSGLPSGSGSASNARRFDNGNTITIPTGCAYLRWYFQVGYGTTYNKDTALNYPSSATTWEPYSVYGGAYDVLEGELKVTYGYIASYNGESLPSKWISDRDVYAAGTTPTTGAEVAYELATPTVYTFTPQQLEMLDGINTLATNTDSLTISYRCYIQKYIQKLIAALA